MLNIEKQTDENNEVNKIIVVGVGGGGGNAVNRLIESGIDQEHLKFISLNTDRQALEENKAPIRLTIGEKLTKGKGAGGDPKLGRAAAEESKEEIAEVIKGFDMIFIAAGMGGGTGTGAAPVIAEIAKSQGILTVAVVTKPFNYERSRMKSAIEGIEKLKENVDTLVVIPNARIFEVIEESTPIEEAFLKIDEVLMQAVTGIVNLIMSRGTINLDFADVCSIMRNKSYAYIGIGEGTGKNKLSDATKAAIESPLLETSLAGAKSLLVNITCDKSLGLVAVDKVMNDIGNLLDNDVNVIPGINVDNSLEDKVIITVIATDLVDENKADSSHVSKVASSVKEEAKAEPAKAAEEAPKKEEPIKIVSPRKINLDNGALQIPNFISGAKDKKR